MKDGMLERMAKGLYEHDRSLATLAMQELGLWCSWDNVEESRRREYIRKARAVLSVQREPTEAFEAAIAGMKFKEPIKVWRAGIDAIEQENPHVNS